MRPPCIVCGRRRGHDALIHDTVRQERRRCANLLRKTWPRLPGLPKLLAYFARQEPPRPAPAPPVEWTVKVHADGTVTHHPVKTEAPCSSS